MSYKMMYFSALADADQYITDNPDVVPVTMSSGFVQNSWAIIFEVPDPHGPPAFKAGEYTIEEEQVPPPEVWDEEKR